MITDYDFEMDGFVVLREVFDEVFLSERRTVAKQIINRAEQGFYDPFEKYYLPHRVDQGVLYDLVQRHPEFIDMVRNTKICDKLSEVLGENIFMYENSLVYKPAGKRNGVPWHQDFISRPKEPIKYIAWCALDPVTTKSGALKVVPGSHKKGFLPWYRVEGEAHHDRLDTSSINLNDAIHVELNPGDVLIFNQLVVHSSDEMDTDDLRLVFRASFQGFEEIYTPRATPLVVRGGSGERLGDIFNSRRVDTNQKTSILKKVISRIGHKLINYTSN